MKWQSLNYPQWQATADTLHLIFQMVGKIKLERSVPRPEWAHVRLYLTIDGLASGIIPGDESPFMILFNLRKHQAEIRNSQDKQIILPLENGVSVAAFYEWLKEALVYIGSPTEINVKPQEFYDPIDFDKDDKHCTYDRKAVGIWLENLLFAHEAFMKYLSCFRGKVDYPAYYFGHMDLSCVVFSGEAAPLKKGNPVTRSALDEKCLECGFWPGDVTFPQAAFYAMPYPFITDINGYVNHLYPSKALFEPAKRAFFLTMEEVHCFAEPVSVVSRFCQSVFEILQKLQPWQNIDWITKPIEYPFKQ